MTWTNESLALHFDKLINLLLARMAEMETAWERATDIARENARMERERTAEQLDARLEGMNEFREQMRDQAAKFVTRRELWAYLGALVMSVTAIILTTLAFGGG